MTIRSPRTWLASRARHRSRTSKLGRRLALEVLETRTLLSASSGLPPAVFYGVDDSELVEIVASEGSDLEQLTDEVSLPCVGEFDPNFWAADGTLLQDSPGDELTGEVGVPESFWVDQGPWMDFPELPGEPFVPEDDMPFFFTDMGEVHFVLPEESGETWDWSNEVLVPWIEWEDPSLWWTTDELPIQDNSADEVNCELGIPDRFIPEQPAPLPVVGDEQDQIPTPEENPSFFFTDMGDPNWWVPADGYPDDNFDEVVIPLTEGGDPQVWTRDELPPVGWEAGPLTDENGELKTLVVEDDPSIVFRGQEEEVLAPEMLETEEDSAPITQPPEEDSSTDPIYYTMTGNGESNSSQEMETTEVVYDYSSQQPMTTEPRDTVDLPTPVEEGAPETPEVIYSSAGEGSVPLVQAADRDELVANLYQQLLNRPVQVEEAEFWSSQLAEDAPVSEIANAISTSTEGQLATLQELYQRLLGRDLDGVGQQTFLQRLADGDTIVEVTVAIVGSPEYAERNGDTQQDFLDAVYRDLLGRTIDAVGQEDFAARLDAGASQGDIALLVVGSREFRRQQVGQFYQDVLGRTADEAGLDFWVGEAERGLALIAIRVKFLASQEFLDAAQTGEAIG